MAKTELARHCFYYHTTLSVIYSVPLAKSTVVHFVVLYFLFKHKVIMFLWTDTVVIPWFYYGSIIVQ